MDRHRWLTVVAVLLVSTAGCAGVASDGDGGEGVAQSIDDGVLHSHLLLYDVEFDRTVRRAGTTALVCDVTGAYNDTISGTYGSAVDATGESVVATDGRVLEIETTVTYAKGTLRYRYAQTRFGETDVTAPEYVRVAGRVVTR